MEDTNRMTITDENGQEREVEIILTFDDENEQSFVLFQDPMNPDEGVYAYKYDHDGNMNEVTDEKELGMCEEVLNAFTDEESDDE